MELDIFEGLESILENDNAQVQVDQVSKLETNSNENGKLKNDWELRRCEIFALQSTLSWTVLLKDDQEELFKLL